MKIKTILLSFLSSLLLATSAWAHCDVIVDGHCFLSVDIIQFEGISAPALSSSNTGRMYFDVSAGKLQCSEDGGAYGDCVGAGGSISDAAYGAGWNGDTTNGASKNALYDKIETLGGGFDPTAVDAVTWSDGLNASNIWTFDLSGTDPTLTFSSGAIAVGGALTATSYGGIVEANLVDKSAIETISGVWTHTANLIAEALFDLGTTETFTDLDTTPDVSTGALWITNTSAVTIDDFDGSPGAGQLLIVRSDGAITYDCTISGLICGSTDIVTASGDITIWIYNGVDWNLLSYMDVSTDLGTDASAAVGADSIDGTELADAITVDGTGLDIGDGGGTNETRFGTDGKITFGGTAKPKKRVYISATAGMCRTTAGCTDPTQQESTTNKINYFPAVFADDADDFWQFEFTLPENYDGGTFTYAYEWIADSDTTSGGVSFFCQLMSITDDDALDTAFGTAVEVADDWTAAGDFLRSAESSAVTASGSPTGGDKLYGQCYRDVDSANDDLAGGANDNLNLLGVWLTFGIDALSTED